MDASRMGRSPYTKAFLVLFIVLLATAIAATLGLLAVP
jgi:hypothetical protein